MSKKKYLLNFNIIKANIIICAKIARETNVNLLNKKDITFSIKPPFSIYIELIVSNIQQFVNKKAT